MPMRPGPSWRCGTVPASRSVKRSWSARTRSGCGRGRSSRRGEIGTLRSIMGFFSYFNRDPTNIRNVAEWGGGGLMDIGCYPITTSRFVFREEPLRVMGLIERDPEWKVDRLTSAILDFPSGQSIFTCSTQLVPYQRMQFFGTKGRIEVEIPFNAPNDRPSRIFIDNGSDLFGGGVRTEEFASLRPVCDSRRRVLEGDSRRRRGSGSRRGCHQEYVRDRCHLPVGGIGQMGKTVVRMRRDENPQTNANCA